MHHPNIFLLKFNKEEASGSISILYGTAATSERSEHSMLVWINLSKKLHLERDPSEFLTNNRTLSNNRYPFKNGSLYLCNMEGSVQSNLLALMQPCQGGMQLHWRWIGLGPEPYKLFQFWKYSQSLPLKEKQVSALIRCEQLLCNKLICQKQHQQFSRQVVSQDNILFTFLVNKNIQFLNNLPNMLLR